MLHRRAVELANGRNAVLFQFERGKKWLQATSQFGIKHLPTDPWHPTGRLAPPGLFHDSRPIYVAGLAQTACVVSTSLKTPACLLVPISHLQDRVGVLVIGCTARPAAHALDSLTPVAQAFAIALERSRADTELHVQRAVRVLLEDFSAAVSSSFDLRVGLKMMCAGVNRLFAADRSSMWLYDRRARQLALSASSDALYANASLRVATSDTSAPSAVGLRSKRAVLSIETSGPSEKAIIAIPIKGYRRVLGTLVIEGAGLEPGESLIVLERADELGRQLSAALESMLLLDEVLRSRKELDNTFNSMTDLIAVSDREGRAAYVNRAFAVRVGKPADKIVGRPLDEFLAAGTRRLLATALGRRSDHRHATTMTEVEDDLLGGTFAITTTALSSPLGESDALAGGAALVARDVTSRERLEAERTNLRLKLNQSEKLAALGQSAAGIAHELNNPLQGVLGHLELLRATNELPKPQRRDVQRIYRDAARAAKIVRNILVFAGSHRFVRRRTRINSVLSRVLAMRAAAFRAAGTEVVRHHVEGLPRIKADQALLQQALLNVVINAEQSIGLDGHIETRTGFDQAAAEVVIEIRDSGEGIPEEVLPHIFDPFYTTKDVGKGTGLGLAIVQRIIQEHGGQILASNHPEGGAVFEIRLPVERDEVISFQTEQR